MTKKTHLLMIILLGIVLLISSLSIVAEQGHPVLIGLIVSLGFVACGAVILEMKRIQKQIAILSKWTQSIASGEETEVELTNDLDELSCLMHDFEKLNIALKTERSAHKITHAEILAAKQIAEQANISKSLFLANMSHEIRTPLTAILGMSELLSYTTLGDSQAIYVQSIQSSSKTLLRIVNDVLDFSKIEAGKMVIEQIPFNMREVLEDVCSVMAESAQSKGLELYCEIDTNTHVQFQGDPNRLRQILINLIGNAIKFTEVGEIILKMTTRATDDQTVTVQLSVSDTGIGIEATKINEIFDAFSQADSTITRRFGGTGLGLTIVKQLAQLMNGEMQITSHVGVGSTFSVILPLQIEKEQIVLPTQPRIMKNVLIIDNKVKSKELLAAQLTRWSVHYSIFNSMSEVLQQYSYEKIGFSFDTVLFNVVDSSDAVLSFCDELKTQCANMPSIIALCNLQDAHELQKYNATMNITVLPKPARQSQLYNAIHEHAEVQVNSEKSNKQFAFKVLVAEDNVFNQHLAKAQFEALGCRITIANDGKEALSFYKRNDYDVIFMDCHMPNVDGYLATQLIREFEIQSERVKVPIVALTANSFEPEREKCLLAGMDSILTKPYTRQDLSRKLQELMDTKPMKILDQEILREAPTLCGDKVIINQASLEELRELNDEESPNFFESIINDYLETTPDMIQEITRVVSCGDLEKARFLSHTIKSSSATVGALHFAELCRKIESTARENDLEKVTELTDLLTTDYQQVEYELRKTL